MVFEVVVSLAVVEGVGHGFLQDLVSAVVPPVHLLGLRPLHLRRVDARQALHPALSRLPRPNDLLPLLLLLVHHRILVDERLAHVLPRQVYLPRLQVLLQVRLESHSLGSSADVARLHDPHAVNYFIRLLVFQMGFL